MKVMEFFDDAGVMTRKELVDEKRLRWFYWDAIPLALLLFCLLNIY